MIEWSKQVFYEVWPIWGNFSIISDYLYIYVAFKHLCLLKQSVVILFEIRNIPRYYGTEGNTCIMGGGGIFAVCKFPIPCGYVQYLGAVSTEMHNDNVDSRNLRHSLLT